MERCIATRKERTIGILARDESGLIAPARYLSENMPERVYPPGRVSAYSNYGAALAGKIVSDTAGMPFEEYVSARIFDPLGMNNSSFGQPLPPSLNERMATGYSYSGDVFVSGGFEYIQMTPAGAMSSTGEDMGAFMIMQLQDGSPGNESVLGPHSLEKMHGRLFSHDPRLPGWTYGFMERESHGWRMLWHGGDTLYFHSVLIIVPELDLGLFAAYNGDTASGAGISLADQFLGRFFPRSRPSCNGSPVQAGDLEGVYISTRSQKSTVEKITQLLSPDSHAISVTGTPGGGIMLDGYPYSYLGDLAFCSPDSGKKAIFAVGDEGEIKWLFLQDHPECAYEKISFFSSLLFQRIVLIACMGVFLSALLLWCGSILLRKDGIPISRRTFQPAHLLFAFICALDILIIFLIFGLFMGTGLMYGVSCTIHAILLLPVLSLVLTITGLFVLVFTLSDNRYSLRDRLEFLIISVTGLVYLTWLSFWNLL